MSRVRSLAGLVVAVGVLIAVSAGASAQAASWYDPRPGDQTPLLMAHQGGEGEYPSNTRIAFDAANAAGADALDTDFHMTKDGVLVLFHDETLEHRTNGTGAVRDKTYAELLQLDFAYWWTPDGGQTYPWRGQGVKVMRMEELFTAYPSQRFGVEMKQVTPAAATTFCNIIKQYHYEKQVLASSVPPDDLNMATFRTACPSVATSATQTEALAFVGLQKLGLANLYLNPAFSSLQLPENQSGINVLNAQFVQAAHNHPKKLKVYAWTIDTPEEWNRFATMGVDGINTSYPQRIMDSL
jgi:glycerophosphoryl diester phosphodiesterase